VIEPSYGLDRILYALLDHGYSVEEDYARLHLNGRAAPIKIGVFPLVNKEGLDELAIEIYRAATLAMPGNAFFDRSLGRILEQEGRLGEALAAYESAAEKDPDSDFYADLVDNTRRRLNR